MSKYLFVYGTLQQASDNDMSRFLSKNSELVGKGHILGILYRISWFPGVVLSDSSSNKVFGTVFKLQNIDNVFSVLDDYEGFDEDNLKESLFTRVQTSVFLENGDSLISWVYLYNQNIENSQQIISGDFLKDATP